VPRYLITYQGGGEMDPSQNDRVKAAFGKWLAEAGQAVLDPGAPTNPVAHVSNGEVVSTVVRGYSLVEAASTDEVTKLLASHPFVGRGGTLQVNEVLPV